MSEKRREVDKLRAIIKSLRVDLGRVDGSLKKAQTRCFNLNVEVMKLEQRVKDLERKNGKLNRSLNGHNHRRRNTHRRF